MIARRDGFSLLELLITLSLVVVVVGTITALFASGARVWEHVQGTGSQEQWLLVAMDQMSRDVRNARRFRPVAFDGSYDELSFPLMVPAPTPTDAGHRELGRAGFFLDERKHLLCRSQCPYRLMHHSRLRDECLAVADDITKIRFEYFGRRTEQGEPSWVTRWKDPAPPLAVKIELTYRDAAARQPVTRTRIVHLPAAP